MAIGNKSIGADIRVVLNTFNGVLALTPDMIGSFTFNPVSEWLNWLPVTGRQERAAPPNGYEGRLNVVRKGSMLDDFWEQYTTSFYAGVSVQPGSILRTITEPNGAVTQWSFLDVIFRYVNAGEWRGNEFVMQELEWYASDMKKVNY